MGKFRATKFFVILDIVLQLLLFSSNLGILIWNSLHADARDKYFPDLGVVALFVGIASALPSLELDGFLLYFITWEFEFALYWWNFACLGFAILSWLSYMAVTIYTWNLYLGVWAFFYLYTRVTLILMAKAEYLGMFRRKTVKVKENVSRCPSNANLTIGSTVVPTPMAYKLRTRAEDENMESTFVKKLVFGDCDGEDANSMDAPSVNMTFCTFLGSPQTAGADHYMARDEPVIKVNEEQFVEELKTKL